MFKQYTIDLLKSKLNEGEDVWLWYVADNLELADTYQMKEYYKSAHTYKVIKIKLNGIENAIVEIFNKIDNPDEYEYKTKEEWLDKYTRYVHKYVVKTSDGELLKTPSYIFDKKTTVFDQEGNIGEIHEMPIPVDIKYTNAVQYLTFSSSAAKAMAYNGELDWKYYVFDETAQTDGIEYKYATTDYYIFDVDYPFLEKPLIKLNSATYFFLTMEEAFNQLEQLRS